MSVLKHRRREPAPGVHRLILPLPFPGLSRVNAYLLSDPEGHTLVDCGLRDPAAPGEGWEDVAAALEANDARPTDVSRLLVTHPHVDHYGMAARFVDETGCELWMHSAAEAELDAYRRPQDAAGRVREMLLDHGVERDELERLTAFEDWRGFVSGIVAADVWLRGEETFSVGGREWKVIHTPGHSPSHVCLFAPEESILVSGDHLLPTITPHIDFTRGDADPLGEFLASLERIEELEPRLVLPGHGRPFEDGAERARMNARHHDRRLGSILQVIRKTPHTASEITDEIFGTELLHFERRLALGEALAHLAYLRRRGEIERIESENGAFLYKKMDRRSVSDDRR
jgi:glyoxylase-like metal-dependent hydrolase (beta-lactamase superfamily II)